MEQILILDFGSQFTQLIARRVRELGIYCAILPANANFSAIAASNPKALILSGGPFSVFDAGAPQADQKIFSLGIPVLGICYGMQWIAEALGGKVHPAQDREYGMMKIKKISKSTLWQGIKKPSFQVWMSHGDEVVKNPPGFQVLARSAQGALAGIQNQEKKIYALQFHPEVTHTEFGAKILENFSKIAKMKKNWNLQNFAKNKIQEIRKQCGEHKHVLCALSGGVDSTVAATLIEKAIPGRLHCFYVDSGLQRENEVQEVLENLKNSGLNVHFVDAKNEFLSALHGIVEPEQKRKIIGRIFIEVFQKEANIISKQIGHNIEFMVQGTLYPDVIESVPPPGRGGFSSTIKSHHNVGGLPEKMHMQLIEPLRELFKDEVRRLGKVLKISPKILKRHPFPGPGLAVRCLGEITEARLSILRKADKIYIDEVIKAGLYDKIWQAGTILLPIASVGVMGDSRTYENPIALRAVTSQDGMTADWFRFPSEVLAKISTRIVNEVKGVNRVVYDISSKPPATIEWE